MLSLFGEERRWVCPAGHSFDLAREGYVNRLLRRRRGHQPGDSAEMVSARGRFLASGAYDPISVAVAEAVSNIRPSVLVDIGCGEGRHTRCLDAAAILGVDVANTAVAVAARSHPAGWYAVATASALPLEEDSVDAAVSIFSPTFAEELARVVRPGGVVVTAHPCPNHLAALRALVYERARPHEIKPPLRAAEERFDEIGSVTLRFPLVVTDVAALRDLFDMTPYRWHGPRDIEERLTEATRRPFASSAEVRVTTYRRRSSVTAN
jgi:23S rRNA (guanine745-N1)-methyltransferase